MSLGGDEGCSRGKRGRMRAWRGPGEMSVAKGDWRPQIPPSIYSHICDPITTCMVPLPSELYLTYNIV